MHQLVHARGARRPSPRAQPPSRLRPIDAVALGAAALGVLLVAGATRLDAQAGPDSAAFVVQLAGDTVLVERFHRTADSVTGEIVGRQASGRVGAGRAEYRMSVGPAATVTGIDVVARRGPAEAAQVQEVRVRFVVDPAGSAWAVVSRPGDTTTRRFPVQPHAIPMIGESIAHVGQVIRRAIALGGDSVAVPLFLLDGGRQATGHVIRVAPDSVRLVTGDTRVTLRVDAQGRVLSGGDPARRIEIRRVSGMPERRLGRR